MKALVTGGCGFIGSNFIINNISKYDKILNVDSLTYAANIENLSILQGNSKYSFVNEDISNTKNMIHIINQFMPDVIIHFAAESHVDRSIDSPLKFIHTNVLGTASLLQSSLDYYNRKKRDFRFIHISTDEVYGSLKSNGVFNELSPHKPNSPYSASKASSDHIVRAWYKTYDLPVIITNCSNNYGPYQFPEKLIPLMIANCIDEKPLPIYGNGKNIRDWIYVSDHCDAIQKIIKDGSIGETYNIGGNNEIENIQIVKIICDMLDDIKPCKNFNSYSDLIRFVDDRPGHDFRYAVDSSKLKNQLKWVPIETIKTGMEKTIKWYLANQRWWRNIQKNNYNQERLGLKK